MDVHRHAETARLRCHISKEKVLKMPIFRRIWCATACVARIDRRRLGSGSGTKIERSQVGNFELDCHSAVLSLTLECRRHDAQEVFSERRGKRADAELLHVTIAKHV